jgi:hypothetical protein
MFIDAKNIYYDVRLIFVEEEKEKKKTTFAFKWNMCVECRCNIVLMRMSEVYVK